MLNWRVESRKWSQLLMLLPKSSLSFSILLSCFVGQHIRVLHLQRTEGVSYTHRSNKPFATTASA
ncbi:hypothetical protein BT69DRAFT_290422 [Atractiella rhizophila]|nr:hypothetical protein BT69DRAFT_290422 [Atractiella rhizophila]